MVEANMVRPNNSWKHPQIYEQSDTVFGMPDVEKLLEAIDATAEAASVGIGLAAVDGPLPIGDIIGFVYFSATAVSAWVDFFDD